MSRLTGITVLVVDDDEMMREVVSDMLKHDGASVSEAANGVVAFEMVQRGQFDVIVSDVRMPGGDGINLAKNLTSLKGEKPLLFICSGYNDLSPASIQELQILKIFEKPFNGEEMVIEIAKHLSSRREFLEK